MFPLSHMLKSFVRNGSLKVIDADGKVHVFAGGPGPSVTMRLTDRALYRKLFFNPELHAGEAYMDGRLSFESLDAARFSHALLRQSAVARRLSAAERCCDASRAG